MKRKLVLVILAALIYAAPLYAAEAVIRQPISDGSGGTTTVTATSISAAMKALDVNISGGATITLYMANTDANTLATAGHVHNIDNKMVSGTDIGDVTVNNAAGAAAVNIQDGGNTITVDGTVAVNVITGFAIESGGNLAVISGDTTAIDTNTAPLTTTEQIAAVVVAAGATGTIACSATSSSFILAVTGATGTTYYSYTGDATGDPRMVMFQNEKFFSPEGLKVSAKTINLYNPTAATATYYLECRR